MRYEIYSTSRIEADSDDSKDKFHGFGFGNSFLEGVRDLASRDKTFALNLSVRTLTWWNRFLYSKNTEIGDN